ncbi:MAG: hypothetical protein HQL46_01485 [Gammaproteobacteria bacterium]|nr:hypothetical protein [Gammaproteobacteria bacterium]
MNQKIIYTFFESGFTLDIAKMCQLVNINQHNFPSTRKMISQIKKQEPDYIITEFIYSPSLGTQISVLDGIFGTVERFCQNTQLIVYSENRFRQHLETVREKFTIHHVLEYPVNPKELQSILK